MKANQAKAATEPLKTKYEEKLWSLQHEMEHRQGKLSTTQSTIKKLEETQVAKNELVSCLEENRIPEPAHKG